MNHYTGKLTHIELTSEFDHFFKIYIHREVLKRFMVINIKAKVVSLIFHQRINLEMYIERVIQRKLAI